MKNRIKELRASKDMTQSDLARALNVTTRSIIGYEKDMSRMSFCKVVELAKIFDVEIKDLLKEE